MFWLSRGSNLRLLCPGRSLLPKKNAQIDIMYVSIYDVVTFIQWHVSGIRTIEICHKYLINCATPTTHPEWVPDSSNTYKNPVGGVARLSTPYETLSVPDLRAY